MNRTSWTLAGGAGAALAITAGVVAASSGRSSAAAEPGAPVSTAAVERGRLSAAVAQTGTLTYRARLDGSPYPVFNRAAGTYTALPEVGDRIACGEPLFTVDDQPVLLLCGGLPAYRGLRQGARGRDVRQLNRNLRALGADRRAGVDLRSAGASFTWQTREALEALQRRRGLTPTGRLAAAGAVVLPGPVRVAKRDGEPGGAARPGAVAIQTTSTALHVRVELPPYQQRQVKPGARARVVLPGSRVLSGRVTRIGRVAATPAGKDPGPAAATVPVDIRLEAPQQARGLDEAPVQVEIQTAGVADALSVPVSALVGRTGGGFAVERVHGSAREQVAVKLGLFDSAGGRVQVEGDLRAGDRVVVPPL